MNGSPWTVEQLVKLRELYPDTPTRDVAKACGHAMSSVYRTAAKLRVKKSVEFRASPASGILVKGHQRGVASRYPKGHVPANKGLRRPGWAPGRMAETQFKKGRFPANRDPEFYVLGALRVNADGYIDMRVSFEPGALGWKGLHRILWEDKHGPIPKGHNVVFRDREKLNVCIENLELITRAEQCRRNSIHNLPAPLKQSIQLLGALKRQINRRARDEEHRRPEGAPVSDAGGSAGQKQPDGSGPREGGRRRGAGRGRLGQGGSRNGTRYRGPRRQRILAAAGSAEACRRDADKSAAR